MPRDDRDAEEYGELSSVNSAVEKRSQFNHPSSKCQQIECLAFGLTELRSLRGCTEKGH